MTSRKSKPRAKAKAKKTAPRRKPATKAKAKAAKPKAAARPKPARTSPKAAAPRKAATPAPRPAAPGEHRPAAAAAASARPAPRPSSRKSRRATAIRRGPDGEILQPGEILIPGGPRDVDEIHYLLRGSVAAEHEASETGLAEVLAKRPGEADTDVRRVLGPIVDRFEKGPIEPLLPQRPPQRRNFQGVVERAKHRRREIGAFLRGLDLGRTETSHMDSHGEASLQSLMEWAARLENLAEADEPDQADYAQFHRGLDQLENTTEALILDVELTLRRVRDRARAR